MASLTYHPTDAALAARIEADLSDLDMQERTTIVILSPQAVRRRGDSGGDCARGSSSSSISSRCWRGRSPCPN